MNPYRIDRRDLEFAKCKIVYLHDGKDIGSGAFDNTKNAEIRILLPRTVGAVSVSVNVFNESFSEEKSYKCNHISSDLYLDTYSFFPDRSVVGLFFFDFKIISAAGMLFGKKGKGRDLRLSSDRNGDCFQLSMCDFKYPEPKSHYGGIIYHVFVDRFCRGGKVKKRKDAILIKGWEGEIPEYPEYPGAHLENNTFFGGTLYGVIEKLDYLKSLGTTAIYLSPIFEAYSNHKYDTGDYMKVDDMFGGDKAFEMLIKEARLRNIGIILDGVFNHTGSDSKYFNAKARYDDIGAYQSQKSDFYSWYDFQSFPDKYTCWWGIKILPRINPDIPECGNYIAGEKGVIEKYASMGIGGFRLDVADELSDDFLSKIKCTLFKNAKDSILYGEVWEDASNKIAYDKRKKYYLGKELDGVMNYPVREGIISFLKNNDPSLLDYALNEVMFNAPKRVQDAQMNLLGTHDTERIITILAGKPAEGKSLAELSVTHLSETEKRIGVSLVKAAYTILATLPGIPAIFYGDEVGLEGYKDPFNRKPYPWNTGNAEIRDHYIKIGKIRRSSSVFCEGSFQLHKLDRESLIFERASGKERLLTAVNISRKPLTLDFSNEVFALISDNKSKTISILPGCSEIIRILPNSKLI